MRYLLITSYDGENYNGFQKQNNKNTIQDKIENALEIVLKSKINTVASGRTDAKVSAYMQPIHFDYDSVINKEKLQYSLNGILPEDIRVLSISEINFHARFDAKKKTYLYQMYLSNIKMPLMKNSLQLSPLIDIKLMKKFCKLLKGEHDFVGFKASGSETETSTRTIYKAKLKRVGNQLNFYITGNGFLYKMVRNIVGTMIKVGEHKIDYSFLKKSIFKTYKSIHTAPPENLFLLNVEY